MPFQMGPSVGGCNDADAMADAEEVGRIPMRLRLPFSIPKACAASSSLAATVCALPPKSRDASGPEDEVADESGGDGFCFESLYR